jgi:hypothetical protein
VTCRIVYTFFKVHQAPPPAYHPTIIQILNSITLLAFVLQAIPQHALRSTLLGLLRKLFKLVAPRMSRRTQLEIEFFPVPVTDHSFFKNRARFFTCRPSSEGFAFASTLNCESQFLPTTILANVLISSSTTTTTTTSYTAGLLNAYGVQIKFQSSNFILASATTTSSPIASPQSSGKSSSGLGPGTIAGICIGIVVVIIAVVIAIWAVLHVRRKSQTTSRPETGPGNLPPHDAFDPNLTISKRTQEMDATQNPQPFREMEG